MGRHPQTCFRRRGNLAGFEDAAAVCEIRLQHVRRTKREYVAEAPFGEQPLPRCYWNRDRSGDLNSARGSSGTGSSKK